MEQNELKIGRYANVLMDRWFKRTFGWAPARRLMQLFLQEMIPERTITQISFGPQEYVNPIEQGKDIRLDVHCTDETGAHFIVEMQFAEQKTFYERALFNSTFVIQEQVQTGSTDWTLPQIYFIGVVNFALHEGSDKVLYRYRLKDIDSGEDMPIPVEYIFLEVPNCRKAMTSEASLLDNFCYALKNMPEMEERPRELKGEIFDLLFNSAEINKFAPKERSEYIQDMTTERDRANQLATAEEKGEARGLAKGRAEGRAEGEAKGLAKGRAEGEAKVRLELAKSMLADGLDAAFVSKHTHLPLEEVTALQG